MMHVEGEDDEDEYVAGDPDGITRSFPLGLRQMHTGHPFWRELCSAERLAVVRWLQRGDAGGLLIALAGNPSSPGLRSCVLEAIAGGPETGWRMRVINPIGGRPTNFDKAKLTSLQASLVSDGGDVAALAVTLSGITKGERAKRGRFRDPMQVAMVGIVAEAFRLSGKNYFDAIMEASIALAEELPDDGDDPRNMKRVAQLYDEFLRAGTSCGQPQQK